MEGKDGIKPCAKTPVNPLNTLRMQELYVGAFLSWYKVSADVVMALCGIRSDDVEKLRHSFFCLSRDLYSDQMRSVEMILNGPTTGHPKRARDDTDR